MSKKYTPEHEWIETVATGGCRVGITDYAKSSWAMWWRWNCRMSDGNYR